MLDAIMHRAPTQRTCQTRHRRYIAKQTIEVQTFRIETLLLQVLIVLRLEPFRGSLVLVA
jgi:hypothetical protein